MSLYSQSYYGQPSYGGPSYPPATQTGYQYQYQQQPPPPQPVSQPPPVQFIDPATFRRDYSSQLDQLQFNSRPIIQHLSFYAREYSRYADIVAQCLETHIRKVPPWMKLPAFYLLDAISKNVYDPYARVFASFVIPLFLETYRAVDDSTRSKMDEMLITWRTGGPNGKELFGLAPQIAIERGIWSDQAGSGQTTKAQVMSELHFALQAKERAISSNPNDASAKHHIQVLLQLRGLVEAGVSHDELAQIQTQLHSLTRPQTTQLPLSQPQWTPATQSSPPAHPTSYTAGANSYSNNHTTFPVVPQIKMEVAPPTASSTLVPADMAQLNISNILSTLMKSGLVTTPASNTGTSTPTQAQQEEERPTPSAADLDAIREARSEYRKRILLQNVVLSTNDIAKPKPAVPDFLYEYLSLQCKQCGMRYPDTTLGKRNLEEHLDMHFRQNRKLNQNLGRGHSRSSFISVEDWVSEPSDDKDKPRPAQVGTTTAKVIANIEKAKHVAELRSQYVTVPAGDEAKPISCPICKETLQVEFLEDEEEWVWKNAVKKDDRIYHATCHAEAAASTSNLVARLKSEMGGGSRGSTPEALSSRSTPPPPVRNTSSRSPSRSPSTSTKLAGTKRKVTEAGSSDSTFEEQTPPMKKLALSLPDQA